MSRKAPWVTFILDMRDPGVAEKENGIKKQTQKTFFFLDTGKKNFCRKKQNQEAA